MCCCTCYLFGVHCFYIVLNGATDPSPQRTNGCIIRKSSSVLCVAHLLCMLPVCGALLSHMVPKWYRRVQVRTQTQRRPVIRESSSSSCVYTCMFLCGPGVVCVRGLWCVVSASAVRQELFVCEITFQTFHVGRSLKSRPGRNGRQNNRCLRQQQATWSAHPPPPSPAIAPLPGVLCERHVACSWPSTIAMQLVGCRKARGGVRRNVIIFCG